LVTFATSVARDLMLETMFLLLVLSLETYPLAMDRASTDGALPPGEGTGCPTNTKPRIRPGYPLSSIIQSLLVSRCLAKSSGVFAALTWFHAFSQIER
jgi:hypothetical protein